MNQPTLITLLLITTALTLTACQTPPATDGPDRVPVTQPAPVIDPELAVGYARLHRVADRNAGVKDILILKSPDKKIATLLRAISKACAESADTLESIADQYPDLDLDDTRFPEAEQRVRDAVESTTRGELLGSGGATFEYRILITQLEALRYLHHLADVVADMESDPTRAAQLRDMADRFKSLRDAAYEALTEIDR